MADGYFEVIRLNVAHFLTVQRGFVYLETWARETNVESILIVSVLPKLFETGLIWELTQYGPPIAAPFTVLLVFNNVLIEILRKMHHVLQIEDVDKRSHLSFSQISFNPVGRSGHCHSAFKNYPTFSSAICTSRVTEISASGELTSTHLATGPLPVPHFGT